MIVSIHGAARANVRGNGPIIGRDSERIDESINPIAHGHLHIRREPICQTAFDIEIVHSGWRRPAHLVQRYTGDGQSKGIRDVDPNPERLPGAVLGVAKQQRCISGVIEAQGTEDWDGTFDANTGTSPEEGSPVRLGQRKRRIEDTRCIDRKKRSGRSFLATSVVRTLSSRRYEN